MSFVSDKKEIDEILNYYINFLKTVDEESFLKNCKHDKWSYSEVYSHILSANLGSAIAVEKCLNRTAEIKRDKANWKVRLILWLGKFPPGKIKAPVKIAAMVKKISKEDAKNDLIRLKKKIEEIYLSVKSFNEIYKMRHPRLGYLDAKQWFRFILIHSKHHVAQLSRIEKELSKN